MSSSSLFRAALLALAVCFGLSSSASADSGTVTLTFTRATGSSAPPPAAVRSPSTDGDIRFRSADWITA